MRQNAVVRNASVGNVQLPQAGHSSEVREPGITDLGCSEIQLAKVTQTLDLREPGVGHGGAVKAQFFKVAQTADAPQRLVIRRQRPGDREGNNLTSTTFAK